MKKIFILWTMCSFLLFGCNSQTSSEEKNKIYEGFRETLINNGELVSAFIPFTYTIDVEKKGNVYQYDITIKDAQIYMSNIQMLALNLEDLSTDYVSSSKGIFDEKEFSMVPNQENEKDGFLDEIVVSGVSKTKNFQIYCMVVWKDSNQLAQSQAFFSFNVNDKEDVKVGNASE